MLRRRKVKVVWLPNTNAFSLDGARTMWQFASTPITGSDVPGDVSAFEIPVVQDGSQSSPLDPTASLADIESSGYRLRRIVGKVNIFISQSAAGDPSLFGVTAGFIIRRVDPATGTSLASNINLQEFDPSDIENGMDPWIWRRSWILGDNSPSGGGIPGTAQTQNFGNVFQGALDGPHIDQKTARIVGPEERLFLDISASTIVQSVNAQATSIAVVTDLRVLASMRANSGNRRNASR